MFDSIISSLSNLSYEEISTLATTAIASVGGVSGVIVIASSIIKYKAAVTSASISGENTTSIIDANTSTIVTTVTDAVNSITDSMTGTVSIDVTSQIEKSTQDRLQYMEEKTNALITQNNENMELSKLVVEALTKFKTLSDTDLQTRMLEAIGKHYVLVDTIDVTSTPTAVIESEATGTNETEGIVEW